MKNQIMNSILKLIIVSFLLSGCKAWDVSYLAVKKEPLTPKLLTLDRKIEDVANTVVLTNSDEMILFTKEVEENLIDPYGDKYGYIIMKRNPIKFKSGPNIPNAILLNIPLLFGVPFAKPSYTLEVEIRIVDAQNKLIGKYSAIGKGKNTIAMYYGYSAADAGRKSYIDAINDAFNQIRPQILADVARINEKLKLGKSN
jgi:hypothetical protein